MNRMHLAVSGALALAAPLFSVLSAPASAAPGQFCQESCFNSGYRYVKDASVSGSDFQDGETPFPVGGASAPRAAVVRPAADADPQTLGFFCDGPGPEVAPRGGADLDLDDRDLIDSLDADQATASINAAASALTAGGGLSISPRILTDSRGRPVGLSARFDDADPRVDLEEIDFDFQLVCLDDRDPVSP